MSRIFSSDRALIEAILKGGALREKAMKQLVLDRSLIGEVEGKLERMGAGGKRTFPLLDIVLIRMIRDIKKGELKRDESVFEYILEMIRGKWISMLRQEEICRKELLDHISVDEGLKQRVRYKMQKMGCKVEETEDYYNQGFLKMNEILLDGKFKGGDVKALFFRICEHFRLNDLRKIKELFPEQLPEQSFNLAHDDLEKKEKRELLKGWLSKIGEKCKKTLQMWNDGYNMKEIAQEVPYKNHLEAAVAKHRCMKKIYDLTDFRLWK